MDTTQKETLERLERKLDEIIELINSFEEDEQEDDPNQLTLDGEPAGRPRDESQSL